MGVIEIASDIPIRACERSFPVPEKFAFEEVFRDRAAIDRDKFVRAPVAQLVNRARNQFLPDAGFPGNNDIGVRRRRLGDEFVNGLHDGRFPDHVAESRAIFDGQLEPAVFLLQPGFFLLQRLLFQHLLYGYSLGQHVRLTRAFCHPMGRVPRG